ncbi:MAG TPA: LLM class flavin-dependent oxidoreductase, partial [bacterium]|nr:LLM class flavin-dependent oxidoreductase [bacterium]
VRAADRLGYATAWVSEAYGWDAFTQLGWLSAVTNRIGLATGIVNVFSRSPALIAQSAATLDRISGGRCILGLGTSGPGVVEGWHGVPFQHALQRLRETVDIVRLVLERKRLAYAGEVFRIQGGIKLAGDPVSGRVPIYLATLGPRALRMTGEIADGWLAAFFSPSQYAAVLGEDLQYGVGRRAADAGPLSICVYHSVVVSADRAVGRDAVRPNLAFYLGAIRSPQHNFYNKLFQRYGFVEEAARVQQLYLDHQHDEAVRAVTDEMVDRVTIIGPPPECRERLAELASVGVDEVAIQLTVPGGSPADTLAAIQSLAPANA